MSGTRLHSKRQFIRKSAIFIALRLLGLFGMVTAGITSRTGRALLLRIAELESRVQTLEKQLAAAPAQATAPQAPAV